MNKEHSAARLLDQPRLTGTNLVNYSTTFIGNSIYGNRMGERGFGASAYFTINFSGNELALSPPVEPSASHDYPGAAVAVDLCQSASICGNTLVSGGHGFLIFNGANQALVLANNFSGAAYRGIGYDQYGGSLQTASIFQNIIGEGVSFHIELPYTNSFGWFLGGNTYLNAASNSVPPFLDPASSAVHLFN
jgi:hypothetical protein